MRHGSVDLPDTELNVLIPARVKWQHYIKLPQTTT